jgi:phosphoserine phosphatase
MQYPDWWTTMADSPDASPAATALLQSLLAVTRRLTAPSPGRLGEEIVEAAAELIGASARLWLLDEDSGTLVLRAPAPESRIEPGDELLRVLADGNARTAAPGPGSRANACMALLDHDGSLIGALEFTDAPEAGFGPQSLLLAETLAAQAAAALRLARLQAPIEHAQQLHAEVEVARNVQRSTLPTRMPHLPGYDLHGHFQPTTYAGGDLFDIVPLQHGVFLLLGDATGHGFGPALSATQMQGMLRVAFRLGADLDEAFLHVNNQLAEDLPDDRFVTAFMGFLDPVAHAVRFHAAGQPVLHYRAADDRAEWLAPGTFPVGALHMDAVVDADALQLAPGDILALISDGVYEQPGPGDTEFGQQRVCEVLGGGHALPMPELCERLLRDVERFADGIPQADDITVLLVRRLP